MPITIRPSVVKIKKPSTGEYREINALLDTDSAKTVYYGVSSTAADTQTKTVTIEGISALSDGLLVRILFTNAQSYSGVPKLMINSTDASNIKTRRGTDATDLTWKAGDVLDFVYDSSSSGFIVLDKGDIEDLNDAIGDEVTARQNADTALNGAITSLNSAFKTTKGISQLSDFGTESFFFSSYSSITLAPSSMVIPTYSKGIYVTTGNDAVIIGITSNGEEIIAYKNGENWTFPTNINTVLSTLTTNVARVTGTNYVTTESQLIGASKFFDTGANIPLGSTGVTLEAYARGVVLAVGGTGAILAVGYGGRIYSAFFADNAIVNARTFYEYSDQASKSGTFNPSMTNCTPSYTVRSGYYRKISRDMLYIRVQIRGTISAIGNPAYSIISLDNLSALDGFTGNYATVYLREGYACCQTTPYNAIASGSGTGITLSLQTESGVGTSANSWKVTSSTFYIDISAIFVRPN